MIEAGDEVEKRGLARARRAEEADELAGLQADRHPVERADQGAAHHVVLGEVACHDGAVHGPHY